MKISELLLYFRMAFRSALRHIKRNSQIVVIVAIGTTLMTLFDGLTTGLFNDMMDRLVKSNGHGRIFHEGYYEKRELNPLEFRIENVEEVMSSIQKKYPDIIISPMISGGAFLSSGDNSFPIGVQGIVPFINDTLDSIFTPYQEIANFIQNGSFFNSNNVKGIVVSNINASRLQVNVGDSLVLFSNDAYGSFQGIELQVLGIFNTGNREQDENLVMIDLMSASQLYGIENAATELILFLPELKKVDEFKNFITPELSNLNLKFFTYRDLIGSFIAMLDMMVGFRIVLYVIFFVVAIVGIMNVALISVLSRVREIGTLRAIGFTKFQISSMLIAEILVLGVFGTLLGLLVGGSSVYYLATIGIQTPEQTKELASWSPNVIRAAFDFGNFFQVALIGCLVPVVSAIYPISLASKISVREAMGHIG